MPGIEVSVTSQAERAVVRVSGQLDHGAVVALRRQLSRLAEQDGCLVLDFSDVSFMGFAGVALVEALSEQVRSAGGEMEVWGADDPRLRALHLNGALRALRIQGTSGASSAVAVQERNRLVLQEALAAALRVIGAPMGNAQLLDPASRTLRIAAQRGFHPPFLSFFHSVQLNGKGSACGAAARQQHPVFVEDVRTSPLFVGTTAAEVLQDAGVHAVASLPVVTPAGTLIGMLSTHCAKPTVWTPDAQRELAYVIQVAGRMVR
ncbi:STAS domain-containing protein [Streptomyces sp. YJ-C3]